MSSYYPKQTPRTQRLTPKPKQHATERMACIPRGNSPYDLEPGFEFLRSLIEARVMERLEQIFQQVRRLETLGTQKAKQRAIRLREVLGILGIGKSTLYSRLNPKSPSHDPNMPAPFRLGTSPHSPSVWWEHEVLEFLERSATACRKH